MKNHLLCIILLCSLSLSLYGQSSTYSYVKSRTMTNGEGTAWLDHIDYDRGLGEVYQQVDVDITPSRKSLYTLYEYDNYRRPQYTWLPAAVSGCEVQAALTIKNAAKTFFGDDSPYSRTVYERSPIDRVVKQYEPGSAWHQSDRCKHIDLKANNNTHPEDHVIGATLISDYFLYDYDPSARYTVESVSNEDGRVTCTFTDMNGNAAVVREYTPGSSSFRTTYYAYTDYGDLRYVLPPEVADYYENNRKTGLETASDVFQKYGYEYRYDTHHHCIFKRLPGCEPVYYINDKAGRCIFSQDGEQRSRGEWSYSIPDVFGRVVMTGVCKNQLTYTDEPLKTIVVSASRSTSGGTYGYTISGVSLVGSVTYTVNYYDDYSFIGTNGVPSALSYTAPPSGGYGVQGLSAPKGLLTGSVAARLSSSGVSGYDYSAVYYDDRGRVVQTRSTNHQNGYDYQYSGYSFTGQIVKQQHVHQASGKAAQTETYTYEYDHAGRLLTTRYKLNSSSEVVLHRNTYDEVGRLISKTNGSTSGMTEAYAYNVRSWPTTISAGSLFSESLYYSEPYGGSTPQYGGNISAMTWKADGKTRGYKFSYDNFSRLSKADYMENGSSSSHYTTSYSYDKMGNLLTLKRNGKQDGGTYGLIDNLTFTYNGNQVTRIDDSVNDPTYNGVSNFVDGANQAEEYVYDKNGNLTKDLNKKISLIQYNLLNLPTSIAYSIGKSAAYIYDAGGRKLRVSYKASPSASVQQTDYCGNMIYENNVLKQILIDGGYITFSGSTPLYHYYLKDHLGNNRVVCSASGSVEQVNHYYPFGGLFGESTGGDTQRYKYNGKELDRMHGLDWYDYGARHMDGMRFTTVDPLADKEYATSPYAYCCNNPIKFIDYRGFEKLDALDPNNSSNRSQIMSEKSFMDESNVINIWAHGSPNGMTIFDKESGRNLRITNAAAFIRFLNKSSSVWKKRDKTENATIVLHSCNTAQIGANGKSFAQSLSENLENVIIIAPTDKVYTPKGNELGTYKSSVEQNRTADGKKIIFSSEHLGNWVQYENGQQTRFYKGNTHPGEKGFNIVTSQSSWWEKIKYIINKYF